MRGLCGVYEMSIATPSQDTGITSTLAPRRRSNFVQTQNVETITRRALAYLNAGFSIHFRGPAGTGKTTLALEVAALLNRPTVMITGDEDMATATLVGSQRGYHYRKVVDRFIHNVTKTEETAEHHWADHRLTTACREGYTLIYDEFTRSRPEANNVLLSVLEEGLLVLPAQNQNEPYITVHPNFRVIFTSNPQEYAGVCAGMSRHPWREIPVRRKDRRQAHAAAQDAAEPYRASLPGLRDDRRHGRGDGTCLTIEPRTTGVTRLAACTASPRCRRSPTAQNRANASIWPPASPGSKTSARASSASS